METTQEKKRCQSCGMPLGEGFFGTHEDGSENQDYCSFCFEEGKFTDPDLTMDQMIELSVEHMTTDLEMTEEQSKELARLYIPKLKRWKEAAIPSA
mgnify:CR=1 FL=1